MLNKKKLYLIALVSTVMILTLVSIAGAAPFAYITNSIDNTVSVIDTATNTVTANVNVGNNPIGVAVAPDGTKVYLANEGRVSVINTSTNNVVANVNVGNNPIGVAVAPDGTKVYVANEGRVSVINTSTNNVVANVNVGNSPSGVTVTPDGKNVYVVNEGSGTVSVIDTSTDTVAATVSIGPNPWGVAVTPDGTKVYVANGGSNFVSVIDTATNTVTANVNVGNNPVGVAVAPDGKNVYVTNNGGNSVSVIDTTTNTVTANVNVGNAPMGVAVTPNGKNVYVVNFNDGTVYVIDTATNKVTASVPAESYPVALGLFIGPGNPALNITKVANPTTYNSAGQQITYTYNVTNTGTVATYESITITDNKIPSSQLTIGISGSVLPPGQSFPGTATYTITQADLDAGFVTNLANATGSFFDSFFYKSVLSNNTSVTIQAIQNPALKMEKEVDPKVYFAVGDILDYDFTVTNTGNVDISGPIIIKDEIFGSKQISLNGLAPGQSITGTASHLVTPSDIYAGFKSNSAYATGSFANKEVTSNSDTATARFFGPNTNLYSS